MSRVTAPVARSTRNSGALPVSSAVTTSAAESGVQRDGGDPAVPARRDVARRRRRPRGRRRSACPGARCAEVRRVRRQATHRPSGDTATGPSTVWPGSSSEHARVRRRPASATSSATRARRDPPCGSSTRHVVTTVDPSGVTSYAACSSAPPGSGVRSVQVDRARRRPVGRRRAAAAGPGPRSWSQYRTGPPSCRIAGDLRGRPGGPAGRVVVAGDARRAGWPSVQTTVPARAGDHRTRQAARPGARRPGLAAAGGQAPQRRRRVVVRAAGRRPGGEEQQVAVRGERGVVLAGLAPGEPARRPGTRPGRSPTARCGGACPRCRGW